MLKAFRLIHLRFLLMYVTFFSSKEVSLSLCKKENISGKISHKSMLPVVGSMCIVCHEHSVKRRNV